jgi:signal transduction histidine kinase
MFSLSIGISQAIAKGEIPFSKISAETNLKNIIYILDDVEKNLTFEEIRSLDDSHFIKFTPQKVRNNSWLKFKVVNDLDVKTSKSLYMVENSFHKVTFYKVFPGNNVEISYSGAIKGVLEREFPTTIPISQFTLNPGESAEVYVQTDIRKNGVYNIFMGNHTDAMYKALLEVNLVYFYIGLVTALIFYQLFLFKSFKDISHLVYFGFGLSMMFVIYVGGGQFASQWGGVDNMDVIFNFGRTLSGIFVIALPMAIFNSKINFPLFHRAGMASIGTISILTIANIFSDFVAFKTLSDLGHVLAIPFCLSLAICAVKKKINASLVFLVAWTVFLTGVVVWMVKNRGAIPINYFTRHSALMASAIEILLVGYAISLKVKHNEEKRFVAEQKMKESEELRRLLRVVCHDISNPLTMVQVAAEKKRQSDNNLAWEWVEKSVHMIVDIIKHVRKLESIKSGKMSLELEKVNLRELLDEIEFVFQAKLEEKNVKINISDFDNKISVMAEKTTLLNDVVANFISNSIKFSNPGEMIDVSVEVSGNDRLVFVKIRDYGIGIPRKILDKLFDPSSSTSRKGTNNEKGTGFGMPLAKSFMDQYGGKVEVTSVEKIEGSDTSGTTTILTLKNAAKR